MDIKAQPSMRLDDFYTISSSIVVFLLTIDDFSVIHSFLPFFCPFYFETQAIIRIATCIHMIWAKHVLHIWCRIHHLLCTQLYPHATFTKHNGLLIFVFVPWAFPCFPLQWHQNLCQFIIFVKLLSVNNSPYSAIHTQK